MNAFDKLESKPERLYAHREAFLLLAQKSLDQMSGSLKALAIAARPDGTNLTQQVNEAASYYEKLLQRMDVIGEIVPTLQLTNRFRDRLPCCIQDVWINLSRQVAEPLQQCVRSLEQIARISQTDTSPSAGMINSLRKNLRRLHKDCLEHEEHLKALKREVESAIDGLADSELHLTRFTERYPLAPEVAEEIERHLLISKGVYTDYLVRLSEYAIGLGFTERYFYAYKRSTPMPAPRCTRTKSYSLRALHAWYRDDVRMSGERGDKCNFDPVRIRKQWIALQPSSIVPDAHLTKSQQKEPKPR